MFVRVSGAKFTEVINNIVVTSKETVHFYMKDGWLYIQGHSVVIYDVRIPVLEVEQDEVEFNCSAVVNKEIRLLNPQLDVVLRVVGEVLSIEQDIFSYTAEQSYEGIVDTHAFEQIFDTKYSSALLRACVYSCKALDGVARSLGVTYSTVNIKEGYAYLKYSNTALILPLDLPDGSLSNETLKKISAFTDKVTNCVCSCVDGIIYFKISENEVVSTNIGLVDDKMVEDLRNMVNGVKNVTNTNISKYVGDIQLITNIYPRSLLNLTVTENGLRFFMDNINSKLVFGDGGRELCGCKISTPQLTAIQKVYNGAGDVVIRKGENKLCLYQKNSRRTLIVAGLVY